MKTLLEIDSIDRPEPFFGAAVGAAPLLFTAISTELGSFVPLLCDLALGGALCVALLAAYEWLDPAFAS